jgi:hypothetical protein
MKIPKDVRLLASGVYVIGRSEIVGSTDGIHDAIALVMGRVGLENSSRWPEIRSPLRNLQVRDTMHEDKAAIERMHIHDGWHRDVVYGKEAMVLWASSEPTEFLLPNGQIVQPAPYDVVLADNNAVEHRIPPVVGPNRWFARWMTETPEWFNNAEAK